MNDILRGLKILLVTAVGLAVVVLAVTAVWAVVGLAWEFCCRVLPLALAGVVVLVGVVGVLWLIGRVARALGGK